MGTLSDQTATQHLVRQHFAQSSQRDLRTRAPNRRRYCHYASSVIAHFSISFGDDNPISSPTISASCRRGDGLGVRVLKNQRVLNNRLWFHLLATFWHFRCVQLPTTHGASNGRASGVGRSLARKNKVVPRQGQYGVYIYTPDLRICAGPGAVIVARPFSS